MSSLHQSIVQLQQQLARNLDAADLPQKIVDGIGEMMAVKNILLIKVDGDFFGPWAEQTAGWEIRSYSLKVIRDALRSHFGYARGGLVEEHPSESQIAGNIHSCLAARVDAGNGTIAAIYCDVRTPETRRFLEEDGNRLKTIADAFAVYVKFLDMRRQSFVQEPQPILADLDLLFVGESPEIVALKNEIRAIAAVDTSVLIYGETGTGKEVLAQALHLLSPRNGNEFVPVHCAAINEGVFESELFGHDKGAFSGAYKKREGKILHSNRGTLFLDEIADIPPLFQTKLLRVLESRKVTPVGSDYELPVDFRLVSATNKDLPSLVKEKQFRDDLYYRVSDIRLRIPPLRERRTDIPVLAAHFAAPKQLNPEAVAMLQDIPDWPGNVRQLKKVVENACKMTNGSVIPKESIARQLLYQDLSPSRQYTNTVVDRERPVSLESRPELNFFELRKLWQDGDLEGKDLEKILNDLYLRVRCNWQRVGKQLGISTPEEMRSFRNWVYYLQRNSILRKPKQS